MLELQAYAEVAGAGGEDREEAVAADAEALVAVVPGGQVADVGDAVPPAHGVLLDGAGRLRVVFLEPVEQSAPVGDAPAVGGALGVAFVHGDVVGGVLPLQQDRQIQSGGPTADAGDLHTHP